LGQQKWTHVQLCLPLQQQLSAKSCEYLAKQIQLHLNTTIQRDDSRTVVTVDCHQVPALPTRTSPSGVGRTELATQ